jgi:elongation factor G
MFHALSPMGMLDELFNGLAAATRGTGWYSAEFDHYQETRAEELTGA